MGKGLAPQLAVLVQRYQCRPDEKCIGCGMEMGDRHAFLCAMKRDAQRPVSYCGCCGNPTEGGEDLWCLSCIHHIDMRKRLVDATYFAQHGEDCPFQDPSPAGSDEGSG